MAAETTPHIVTFTPHGPALSLLAISTGGRLCEIGHVSPWHTTVWSLPRPEGESGDRFTAEDVAWARRLSVEATDLLAAGKSVAHLATHAWQGIRPETAQATETAAA